MKDHFLYHLSYLTLLIWEVAPQTEDKLRTKEMSKTARFSSFAAVQNVEF